MLKEDNKVQCYICWSIAVVSPPSQKAKWHAKQLQRCCFLRLKQDLFHLNEFLINFQNKREDPWSCWFPVVTSDYDDLDASISKWFDLVFWHIKNCWLFKVPPVFTHISNIWLEKVFSVQGSNSSLSNNSI